MYCSGDNELNRVCWAIPENNGTPLKKTWDSHNFYSSFHVRIPVINYPFYNRKGKEDMGIPNF